MKSLSFKNVIVPLLFVGEVFFFGSAALAAGDKAIIGYGWDFLEATTEDVFRNRAKFADSGVDGVLMSVDGVKADGSRYQGRRVMSNFRMRAGFAEGDNPLQGIEGIDGADADDSRKTNQVGRRRFMVCHLQ